jgi:hypothetical protein
MAWILADGTRLDGDVQLSHAFRLLVPQSGPPMLDTSAAEGDDGLSEHAATHAPGATMISPATTAPSTTSTLLGALRSSTE